MTDQATRPESCHPDRPYGGNGLCRTCYNREYARQYRNAAAKRKPAREKLCAWCGGPFGADSRRPQARTCSDSCSEALHSAKRTKDRSEDVYIVRCPLTAQEIVRTYLARGCRLVGGRTAAASVQGPWVAYRRAGKAWIVRGKLPGRREAW